MMDASALATVLERLEREDKVQDDALLQVAEGILSDTDAIFQPFFQCEAPARGLDALFGATSPLGSGLVAERVTPTLKSYLAGALEQGGGFDDVCLEGPSRLMLQLVSTAPARAAASASPRRSPAR